MNRIQKDAQEALAEINTLDPNFMKLRGLLQEIERLSTVPLKNKSEDFSLSLPMKIKERKGRYQLEIPEAERLMIQDCLSFHKFRGGMVQFSLGGPMKSRAVRFAFPGPAKSVPLAIAGGGV